MRIGRSMTGLALVLACALWTLGGWAAEYPAPTEGSWVARNFRFHTGEVVPELRLGYRTIRRAELRTGSAAARHGWVGREPPHAGVCR